MFVLFSALDDQGYKEVKPLVERLEKTSEKRRQKEENWRDLPGIGKDLQDLLPEEIKAHIKYEEAEENESESDEISQMTYDLYTLATKLGKRNIEIGEEDDKFLAFEDLHDTLKEVNQETKSFFDELVGTSLISSMKLPDILKRYISILKTTDLDIIIVKKADNSDRIPIEVYKDVLGTETEMMSYAVHYQLSLLTLYIYD